jgi:hypothetical protein
VNWELGGAARARDWLGSNMVRFGSIVASCCGGANPKQKQEGRERGRMNICKRKVT